MARCSIVVLAAAVLLFAGIAGCAQPQSRATAVDPRATVALRAMCAALAASKAYSFRITAVHQYPAETGQMIQLLEQSTVIAQRPGRLYIENRPGQEVWGLWHDGKSLTLANHAANAFATRQVAATNDAMVHQLFDDYGLELPLADMLCPDPYKVLSANVLSGAYLGQHAVGDVKCTHLVFQGLSILSHPAGVEPRPRTGGRRGGVRQRLCWGPPRGSAG